MDKVSMQIDSQPSSYGQQHQVRQLVLQTILTRTASEDYISSTTHTLSLQVSHNSLKDGVPSAERQKKNTTAPSLNLIIVRVPDIKFCAVNHIRIFPAKST